jgi:hypothetical protein
MRAHDKTIGLGPLLRLAAVGLFVALAMSGQTPQAAAQQADRFEVASIKAVRPALTDTIAALQKGDVAAARAAFDAYDSLWNGIEVYVSTRSKDIYDNIEHGFQARIEKALSAPAPDVAAVLAESRAMLVKYDEMIDVVSKAAPLAPNYDDVARLRIVRAHLREVVPALKSGDFDKARKSFSAFDGAWDSIEDMVKARSADDYVAIEKGMIDIEKALMPQKPDVAAATALVAGVMAKYNATLAAVTKETRGR